MIGIEFPHGKIYEDILTTYKIFDKAKKITYIKDELYFYIKRNTSLMYMYNKKKMLDEIYIINERYNLVNDDYPDFININIMNRIKFIYRYHLNASKCLNWKDYTTKELLEEYKFYKKNYKVVRKSITQYNILFDILFVNRKLFYFIVKLFKNFSS